MSTKYGLLKGKVAQFLREDVSEDDSPHFEIVVLDAKNERYRIPVNVMSTQGPPAKRDVLVHIDEAFSHPILDRLVDLPSGLLDDPPRNLRIDYARGAFVAKEDMEKLPADVEGPDNDLQDALEKFSHLAQLDRDQADIYVWGEPWHDQQFPPDHILGTKQGVHKVHRNQGRRTDAGKEFDDGLLLFHLKTRKQWVAFFIAFQTQSWVTDREGQPSVLAPEIAAIAPHLEIIGAMVNPPAGEKEWLLLFNASDQEAKLANWKIVDKEGREEPFDVTVPAFNVARVTLTGKGARLPDAAGTITLLDPQGHAIDAVQYRSSTRGRLVTFR